MSGTVDYVKVVDHLTDVIKELNQPCVAAPAATAERTAEERKQDAADVLRELLHELEGGGAGAATAEHGGAQLGWFRSPPPPAAPLPPFVVGQRVTYIDVNSYYYNKLFTVKQVDPKGPGTYVITQGFGGAVKTALRSELRAM